MEWRRSSGVLLHVTSLPGRYGVGDLGPEARRFADWLAAGKQKIWQMLPLAPTGYGDSPYQALSAFAGNPLLISLDDLVADGLLNDSDIQGASSFHRGAIDYEAVKAFKYPLLQKATQSERVRAFEAEYEQWSRANADWLPIYAAFATLKQAHANRSWTEWEPKYRRYTPQLLEEVRTHFATQIQTEMFLQFLFARQWSNLRDYCHQRGIQLMGDLPIYVAHDSADVWSRPELFLIDQDGRAKFVAGVPPDYFSATGQLWGNPIYDWQRHRDTDFAWWIERVRASLQQFDLIRVDHFRGFEAYWEVPGGDKTAENGKWVKAPGKELFTALQDALGPLPVLAENLGVITAEVEGLRTEFDLPGMAILQFAFGKDPQGPYFKPHNYTHDRVAYTGTHDNDTVMGWWNRAEATATETATEIAQQHENARRYLRTDCEGGEEVNWAFIRALMASVASAVIFPMQDVLGLGTEARMNYPGTASGNWRWRMRDTEMREQDATRLRGLSETYER
ncbi:MAG TPA: 4-alpha-glucanotransferase [Terriglobales bacterium]|jgi:4-alpha-glucanotransferase